MKSPTVSIIIRTKNEERWITNTLESVFSQSYKDFEVIIGDNESIDKTVNKAKQYPIKEVVKKRPVYLAVFYPMKVLIKIQP